MEQLLELDFDSDDDRDELQQLLKQITLEDALAFLNTQLLRAKRTIEQYTTLLKLYQGIYQDVALLLLDKVGVKMPVVKELTTTLQQLDRRFAAVAAPVAIEQQLYLLRKEHQRKTP